MRAFAASLPPQPDARAARGCLIFGRVNTSVGTGCRRAWRERPGEGGTKPIRRGRRGRGVPPYHPCVTGRPRPKCRPSVARSSYRRTASLEDVSIAQPRCRRGEGGARLGGGGHTYLARARGLVLALALAFALVRRVRCPCLGLLRRRLAGCAGAGAGVVVLRLPLRGLIFVLAFLLASLLALVLARVLALGCRRRLCVFVVRALVVFVEPAPPRSPPRTRPPRP